MIFENILIKSFIWTENECCGWMFNISVLIVRLIVMVSTCFLHIFVLNIFSTKLIYNWKSMSCMFFLPQRTPSEFTTKHRQWLKCQFQLIYPLHWRSIPIYMYICRYIVASRAVTDPEVMHGCWPYIVICFLSKNNILVYTS